MNGWERCNKVSGAYWPRVPPNELTVKISLRPLDSAVPLPKFEDYVNATDTTRQRRKVTTKEHCFKWQEKVFSSWEIQEYADIHNCVTEQHIKYHNAIKNAENHVRNKLFTYVEEDKYEPGVLTTRGGSSEHISGLGRIGSCLERLHLSEGNDEEQKGLVEEASLRNWSSKSICRREADEELWVAMHILLDDFVDSGDIEEVLKTETLLVSLYWCEASGCLLVRPDVNSLDGNPYSARADGESCYYAVHLCWAELDIAALEAKEQLVHLTRKLKRKWQRRHRHLLNLTCPPPRTRRHHYTVELLSAMNFEHDDIYIEYEVRTPPECKSSEEVVGRTHTARLMSTAEGSVANYSHLIQFQLDYEDVGSETTPAPPKLFLEVISVDWWGRERTQGAGLCALPARAGAGGGVTRVECVRPAERGGDGRRFFLGGARLLDDVAWLDLPVGHHGGTINKFGTTCVATGAVLVRVSVLCQAQRLGGDAGAAEGEALASGALFRSVNCVLQEYRRARERLLACRDDIQRGGGGAGPSFLNT